MTGKLILQKKLQQYEQRRRRPELIFPKPR
jgi:hypothetical protein